MGNICGKGGSSPKRDPDSQQPKEKESSTNPENLETFIAQMKEYHRDRIRKELENDPHAFILDNLLMCIQFFDDFDKSVHAANEYKRSAEKEMTELLAKDSLEGTILGDRRIKLLTGMSHILAQNYIYCGKIPTENDDDVDSYYGGTGLKDTFMTEGILPLEFIMSWDNLELYDYSELEALKDYSDAKGASPSARFCMEQPDKRIEFPKGYVRLRCVDEPISHRKLLELPDRPSSDFGYSNAHEPVYSKPYSDGVPEASSESDGVAPHSGSTSEDDDMLHFQEKLRGLTNGRMTSSTPDKDQTNLPSTSKAARQSNTGGGMSKPNVAKLNMPQLPDKNESFPSLVVHAPTPPVHDGQFQMHPFENGFLFPNKSSRILNQHSRSTPSLSAPDRNSPGKETTSSGYDTTRLEKGTRSRASSIVSEMMRDKWQKQNLKKLWEYGKKSRKDQIVPGSRYDPVPSDCYSEIKYEFQYDLEEEDEENVDDDEVSENDDDEDDDSEDFDFNTLKSTKNRKNVEDDYQMRFYLNSLQFSSNACSEFHYIGPTLSIPASSLANGVILGTTIRCPIPYTYPKESVDEDDSTVGNYYVTYSFTPALHSKSWPQSLYFHFNQQIFKHGEKWPSRTQMEQIEMLGCNAIPLGYRSVGFFNAEQILEWELNFHECEINLLDSLRGPHWRAYIFASILMRAFIAPLGPQGVGLEHIRNILYCMCYEDFYGWNDEQPGLHLNKLLGHLFDCLGKGYMPSFFVQSRNLFQSIPQHNIRFIQANLKQICENIIVYCIYAFRNVMNIKENRTYPLPNFKNLYEIVTFQDGELLKILNPILRLQKDREDEQTRQSERQKARRSKKKREKKEQNLLNQQDEIDKNFFLSQREISNKPPKRDRVQIKLRQAHKKHEAQKREDRETQKLNQDPEHRLPAAEKRASIDLKKAPVIQSRFTPLRLLLVIEFFVKHFLKMAKKAVELQNYGQATMYVLQIENLCEIVQEEQYKNTAPIFSEDDFQHYREETLMLWGKIGNDKDQYILSRLSNSSSSQYSQLSASRSLNDLTSVSSLGFPSFTNNWDLRKLPTPPPSEKEMIPTGKKLEKPNIASSLKSFDSFSNTRILSDASISSPLSPRLPPLDRNKPRRQESIKFVSAAVPKDNASPVNSPRLHSRPLSRQSVISLALDRDETDYESTDL